MKTILSVFFVSICLNLYSQNIFSPEELVNPLMGTDSKYQLSNGNTYPAIALPWGMNFWTPQTNVNGDGWQYQYHADKIVGFKQTHQPSPWINDYGCFSIMPIINHLKISEKERASFFSHKAEIAKPYYYSAYLSDIDVTTEISPTERAAIFQFTFPKSDSSFILIDAFDGDSFIKIIPEKNQIIGYSTKNNGGVPANFKNYFIITTNKSIDQFFVVDNQQIKNERETYSNHAQGIIGFKTTKGEKVAFKIASSFISFEQANLNLQNEIGDKNFLEIKTNAKQIWNKELSNIKVEGDDTEKIKLFYSCLYRLLLFPRKFYEINAKNEIVHYSPYNGKVEKGYMFTDNGFWDTFRAVFPFFTLMYPKLNSEIMNGLVNTYKESGWLPEWASPGHRDCMIGSNSASIIADSYLKGIRGYDIDILFEAILKNTNNEGPLSSVGRKGVSYYNSMGYIPYNVGIQENVARSLEYSYADFCIQQLAKKLNKSDTILNLYKKRSYNYKNLFDNSTKLMRGKNVDGSFQTPFNPFKWGDAFTEGNSWHYTWSVFQDINGLKNLMGGNLMMQKILDSVFVLPPVYDASYYGGTIHEITEMQIANMGQYAHGNQPIQHMIYLYNYCAAPWKTQFHVREVLDKLYKPTPDGYCGDEDNGQTSAWFVFSALGFYPVCPGTPQYVLGSPIFKKITMQFENKNKFIILAPDNSQSNRYINNATLNGQKWNYNFINHQSIIKGGILQFQMSNQPNYKRGINNNAAPFSQSKN